MALPKILALIMIVAAMLGAGIQIDRERFIHTFKNYALLAKALLANFILIPLFAWLVMRGFHVNSEVQTGILLMAMAPGVPFVVNFGGTKQGGSLAFAVEFAFLFSALSVITLPLTAQLLLPPEASATVRAAQFLSTLVLFQLLPLLAGVLLKTRLTATAADNVARALRLLFIVTALALTALLATKLWDAVTSVAGFGHLLMIAGIGLFCVAAGWLLGGPDRQYRRTLSVASLMRNIGLCAVIATNDFAGSLVLPTIITYFFITFLLSLPIRIAYKRTADAAAAR